MTSRLEDSYPHTPYRVEYRPVYAPHSQDELLSILDKLSACGVRAWWYGVATKGGYPFFASKHLPHSENTVDYLPWLVEQAHERGIVLFAWHYFATAPYLAGRHADWGWKYFDGVESASTDRDRHFFCHNSPYGEIMIQFSEEVVREIGFDGIWYDGSLLFRMEDHRKVACCCNYCAKKYAAETGRDLPEAYDLNSMDFRRFLEWRQADYMDYWRRLSQHVQAKKPQAVIAFNHFNRFNHHAECGSPLWRLADDVSSGDGAAMNKGMPAMVVAERGHWQQHGTLMAKTLRAINDKHPPELWIQAADAPGTPQANVDSAPLLYHARMCATAGAFASFGVGAEITEAVPTLNSLSRQLNPLAPYVGGTQAATVGVVLSGATKDYAYCASDGKNSFPGTAWKSVFGTEAILGGLHVPSDILLDNMLCDEYLNRYQAVILPEVQCLSDESAAALIRYVESGGLLLAVGDTGTRSRLGEERTTGVLDEFFGITWRAPGPVRPLMKMNDARLVDAFTHDALPGDRRFGEGLPPLFGGNSGLGRLVRADSAHILAEADYRPPYPRKYGSNGLLPPDPSETVSCASILEQRRGKGRAVYVVPNIAADDAQWGPKEAARETYARLLLPHLLLPFTTDAPPDVLVTLWEQADKRVFHLLKLPANCRTLPWYERDPWPPEVIVSEDQPVAPIRIRLRDEGETVSPVTEVGIRVQRSHQTMHIALDGFVTHASIVLSRPLDEATK